MLILGIETSCDDTAAALVEVKRGRFMVYKNVVASQANLHAKYKGVVPEVAARAHLETIVPVINKVLSPLLSEKRVRARPAPMTFVRAGIDAGVRSGVGARTNQASSTLTLPSPFKGEGISRMGAIAVTAGPGLITSLLVGVETAKALSFAWGVPLVGVNHIEGHIYSPLLPEETARVRSGGATRTSKTHPTLTPPSPWKGEGALEFPAIALIVSGGHTELILMTNHGQYKLLGRTRDDAAGETFDKAAAMLGLPYPGGPIISKLAERGNPAAFALPRPMIDRPDFEFSFSGLKNAIRLLIEELTSMSFPRPLAPAKAGRESSSQNKPKATQWIPAPACAGAGFIAGMTHDLCAAIEQAIVDVLVAKSLAAVAKEHPQTFILAGGVAANKKLRQALQDNLPRATKFLVPRPEYCMDNAAMIAAAAYHHIETKKFSCYDKLKADANWELV